MELSAELSQRISDLVGSHRVVLFMKGSRHFPQCGFSATVVQILNGLVPEYGTVNVLTDPELREGIKHFSQWPTIPQLYVDGKFIGGCDIVREMFQEGELQALLGVASASQESAASEAPKLTVTEAARRAIAEAKGSEPGTLRLEVSPDFEHALSIDEAQPGDFEVDAGGIVVLVDAQSAERAGGVRIDYSTEQGGGGFVIDNPNEPARVRELSPQGLKQMIDLGERFALLDVRTPEERALAKLEGSRTLEEAFAELDKDTPVVVYCHHGGRSQMAAQRLAGEGFRRVYNLSGGIDAWSQSVDPSVPRY